MPASGWSKGTARAGAGRGANCTSVWDAGSGQIVAAALTTNDVDDGTQVGTLLDQIDGPIASFTADGAYDQGGVYGEIGQRHPMRL